jgi:hypothetical protein
VRRAVRAGGLTFAVRDSRKELYPLCTMTSNNVEWERGWFYLRNDGAGFLCSVGAVLMVVISRGWLWTPRDRIRRRPGPRRPPAPRSDGNKSERRARRRGE